MATYHLLKQTFSPWAHIWLVNDLLNHQSFSRFLLISISGLKETSKPPTAEPFNFQQSFSPVYHSRGIQPSLSGGELNARLREAAGRGPWQHGPPGNCLDGLGELWYQCVHVKLLLKVKQQTKGSFYLLAGRCSKWVLGLVFGLGLQCLFELVFLIAFCQSFSLSNPPPTRAQTAPKLGSKMSMPPHVWKEFIISLQSFI